MRVWLCLVYKFTENYFRLRFFSDIIKMQKRYPTTLDKRGIQLRNFLSYQVKFFLRTKFLESLLLAKYLTSVAATLI